MNHQSIPFFLKTLTVLLLLCANYFGVFAQKYNPAVIQANIQKEMLEHPTDFQAIYILLEHQVDFQALEQHFQYTRTTIDHRASETITALKEKAHTTQSTIRDYLEGNPLVKQESIHPRWLVNAIFAEARPEAIAYLSNLPEVAWIGYNGNLQTASTSETIPTLIDPNSSEPGLLAVNAPALWAKGYTGYGTTVFINDTGVYPQHPALFSKYKGHYEDGVLDFFDYDFGRTFPYDCGDHGTHVCGTTLGLDRQTRDTIGVAFNAQWIGGAVLCNMSNEDVIASFEWALDIDNDPSTTDEIPDVINNSWWDPYLVAEDCQSVYVPLLQALELAGIAVIFSAGNEGPDDMTITPPHNINFDTLNSFTVAAVRTNSPYAIANFSSRGPSHCGGVDSYLIKPEVAAPGVNVRSCIFENEYGLKSGTSMAAPHTSGVVLLLKEAFPELTGRAILSAIYNTCTDLGSTGEDNTYGKGLINAEAAFEYLLSLGHTPTTPTQTNDVILVDTRINRFECDEEINPYIVFENAGRDTLYTLTIEYTTDVTTPITLEWEGVLLPDEQTHLFLDALPAPVGEQNFRVTLLQPNGIADFRPLNNQMMLPVKVSSNTSIDVYTDADVYCQGLTAVVHSTYQGAGEVQWYDDFSDGILLGTGAAFETSILDTTQTIFANILHTEFTGLENNDSGNPQFEEDLRGAIIFDALSPFTLKSVKVYYESTGGREMSLFNSAGELVNSEVFILGGDGDGEARVDLDFDIPIGQRYYLALTQGKSLLYNKNGGAFPYTIPDIARLMGGTVDTFTVTNDYYFFYDWEVEYADICGRTAVEIPVSFSANAPVSSFEQTLDTVYLDENMAIAFQNTSQNAQNWLWDFGDGTTSTDATPTHTYTTEGVYPVSLTTWNAEGCADASLSNVTVLETIVSLRPSPTEGDFQLFPNPNRGVLYLDFGASAIPYEDVEIYDAAGRLHMRQQFSNSESIMELDVQQLPSGLYYLLLKNKEVVHMKKFVRQY